MNRKQMKDHDYFLVNSAITFAINKVLGKEGEDPVAEEEQVDRLTDEFFKLTGEFDQAMKGLAKKREEEGL